jgi:hypothetical protein
MSGTVACQVPNIIILIDQVTDVCAQASPWLYAVFAAAPFRCLESISPFGRLLRSVSPAVHLMGASTFLITCHLAARTHTITY